MFWKDDIVIMTSKWMFLLNQQSDATERMVSGRAPVSVWRFACGCGDGWVCVVALCGCTGMMLLG